MIPIIRHSLVSSIVNQFLNIELIINDFFVFADMEVLTTSSGEKLLISGWWGWLRQPNYLGDILMYWAFVLPCGKFNQPSLVRNIFFKSSFYLQVTIHFCPTLWRSLIRSASCTELRKMTLLPSLNTVLRGIGIVNGYRRVSYLACSRNF